jgi:4-amino-4-deoxy-L-arabinose transferase-like glycosyltransferase
MTKYESAIHSSRRPVFWWPLAILAVFVYFFGLNIPLVGPDEPRYAQVAREMLDRGDWITPTLGGFNWFEKPPLLYWLEILSYKALGVSEFAARLGPAIFGLGTIASLWLLGRSFDRSTKASANWLALIAASTLGIIVFSHGASFDIIVTFPITAALVSFFIFDRSEDASFAKTYLPLVLFYVFVGVALLAKGLIGIIFPFAIVGIYYLLSRRLPPRAFVISLVWGTLLAVAVASVWYLPMYQRHGYEFINEFFIQHHFQRFTSNKYLHPQPFYFYLWVLPLMTLPWLPFFVASIWTFRPRLFRAAPASQALTFFSSPLLLFSASWLLVPLFFFSVSGSKLPGYILPSVPAAIILTSAFVFELTKKSSKWQNAIMITAASTFVATILLIFLALPRYAESDSVKTLIQSANERGYHSNRVLTLYTISHNAEFYAAGRLLRDAEGKQRHLDSISEVKSEIVTENGQPVLVLIPLESLSQLTNDEKLNSEVIKNNGELAITTVSIK